MSITIEMGWWLLPAAITVLSIATAWLWGKPNAPASNIASAAVEGLLATLALGAALIVSLTAWLAWALA